MWGHGGSVARQRAVPSRRVSAAAVIRRPVVPVLLSVVLAPLLILAVVLSLGQRKPDEQPVSPPGHQAPTWLPPYGDLTVEDVSGHGNHGLIMGDTFRGVPGHTGTAYAFDDRGSWVEIPTTASLNPRGHDFVVSAWVRFARPPRGNNTFDIVRKGLSFTSTGMYKLELVSNGRARCTAKDGAAHKARITSPQTGLANRSWHQIGCARVGSTWSVIVDGKVTSKEDELGLIENEMALSIGSKYGSEDLPHGAVDDVLLAIGGPASLPVRGDDVATRIAQLERSQPAGHWPLDEQP